MLVEEQKRKDTKEVCPNCGSPLDVSSYIYRRRSTVSGYLCSNCGFYEFDYTK